jgi:hypothetical protein
MNLARIRDNQRRSRARRKEYLQDLEERFRNCEQMGVEASAEIQAAARRVVDENKRLRALLKQRGLSDADIDGSPIEPTPASASLTASAKNLENLLATKRICTPGTCGPSQQCSPPANSSPATPLVPKNEIDFTTSTPSMTSPPPLPLPLLEPMPGLNAQDYLQNTYLNTPTSHLNQEPFLQDFPHPSTLPFDPYSTLPLDPNPSTYQSPSTYQNTWDNPNNNNTCAYASTQPLDAMQDTQPCRTAVGILRSIDPRAGDEVERQLGCGVGQECQVPTQHVFEILSRISGLGAS